MHLLDVVPQAEQGPEGINSIDLFQIGPISEFLVPSKKQTGRTGQKLSWIRAALKAYSKISSAV